MKKNIKFILTIICLLSLTGCSKKDTHEIEILVPAGSMETFAYSDEEICPTGNKITISSGAGLGDTEVFLKTVEVKEENAYEPTYLTSGMPVKMDVEKDGWFKIGVAIQNDSDKAITVSVIVDGVNVRIADKAEIPGQDSLGLQEVISSNLMDGNGKIVTEPSEKSIEDIENPDWGIELLAEEITPAGLTIKCKQSGGSPTGDLQTGSWFVLENWSPENGWTEVDYIIEDTIAWTQEAWIIPLDDTCEWEVNWEWLYGQLPAGYYRIGKEITDFRASGDYDETILYTDFVLSK